jgi:6-phosphofructo-2-kinase/fructose-2,6-biphosphatase 4
LQSYHDLAVRLEPIILELEREQNDLLIIAHESVLRVLYAYLMHCSTNVIPSLKFPRDEIIEIIPAAYQNEAKRIHIPGLDPKIVPSSPDGTKITIPGSGVPSGIASGITSGIASGVASGDMSPLPGPSTPAEPVVERPPEKVINTAKDMVADKVDDED